MLPFDGRVSLKTERRIARPLAVQISQAAPAFVASGKSRAYLPYNAPTPIQVKLDLCAIQIYFERYLRHWKGIGARGEKVCCRAACHRAIEGDGVENIGVRLP